ncbi:hypothetical protein ACFP1I_24890 [Dyadobacter subterraneus]|uniref:Uncharacterized protein n=1 Tax=Dyadobacter subterraneus TaxID=2773304 RepID=A0ABR9WLD0_9BACT|nr:hypothetical protein [Dyadobacter subterraneus]MBE9466316.1 hypothetical protein [Dyadobacter subterraneus]
MDILQLHYYLENNSHSMDATVKNRAEAEIIKIFKEVASLLELDIDLEIAALEPGGIKEIFKFLRKKKHAKMVGPILVFLGGIISGVIVDLVVTGIQHNSELDQLNVKKTELEIKKLQRELELLDDTSQEVERHLGNIIVLISQTDRIRRYKSNFYSSLLYESKVEKIGITTLDNNFRELSPEMFVDRSDFRRYVVDQIMMAPVIYREVLVEIVAPVLKSGKLKWKGIYNSETINFNLHDAEFRQSVINREVSFTNGSIIKCDVEFERQMDQNGDVKVASVNVSNVTELIQGQSVMETSKGRRRRIIKSQLGLFE